MSVVAVMLQLEQLAGDSRRRIFKWMASTLILFQVEDTLETRVLISLP